jgi:hypothetical protein
VNEPLLVVTSAVYVAVGSMQVGGGPANCWTRFWEPSAGGHGVGSVSVTPSGGAGRVAPSAVVVVVSPGVVVVGDPSALVELESWTRRAATPSRSEAARTTPTTVMSRCLRCWRVRCVRAC